MMTEPSRFLTTDPGDPKFRKACDQACRRMWMSITIPLCINGHEYHRRQKARRRRGRK